LAPRTIDELLEASSLGTEGARRLRDSTPPEVVDRVMARIESATRHEPESATRPLAAGLGRAAAAIVDREPERNTMISIVRLTSKMRSITEAEAVAALAEEERGLLRRDLEVATAQFADAVEQGDWDGQDAYLREMAARARETAAAFPSAATHVFALAEVPHIIALGAHFGSERKVIPHDQNGDGPEWQWVSEEQTVDLVTTGDDGLRSVMTMSGPAVLRVSISALVSDVDVAEVVGNETVADVTVTHAASVPQRLSIRSIADVEAVRKRFREAYGALRNARPNIDVVHLFVAAPPSVCFAIGQELALQNSPPIQTWRYRNGGPGSRMQAAVLLTSESADADPKPLDAEQLELAARLRREVWPVAIAEVETYAANRRVDGTSGTPWYAKMVPGPAWATVAPFPGLRPLAEIAPTGAVVSPQPYAGEFRFESNEPPTWHLNDNLVLRLWDAADADDARLRMLVRLFLFHEYVHLSQGISSYTAGEVGKFANCLEHIDYTADVYALAHQLDLARQYDGALLKFEAMRRYVGEQIDLMLRTYWAFGAETRVWPVRRIRRILNWYWRQQQVESTSDEYSLVQLLARQPRLEIGGLHQSARGPRVMAQLDRVDSTVHLELAIVMEDEILYRRTPSPALDLRGLLDAIATRRHADVKAIFRGVYDTARGEGFAVQPPSLPNANVDDRRRTSR
jgi:hypothetical protein